MVEAHHHHTVARERCAIVQFRGPAAGDVRTTMDPGHRGPQAMVHRRCPHVEEKTILIGRFKPAQRGEDAARLRMLDLREDRPEDRAASHAVPRNTRLGRPEPPGPGGRLREGYSPECHAIGDGLPENPARYRGYCLISYCLIHVFSDCPSHSRRSSAGASISTGPQPSLVSVWIGEDGAGRVEFQ